MQVGVVVRDALALGQAARIGVRVAAITADDHAATEAIRSSAGPLDPSAIDISITPAEGERSVREPVTVFLTYPERLRIPVVSTIIRSTLTLKAQAVMQVEHTKPSPTPEPP